MFVFLFLCTGFGIETFSLLANKISGVGFSMARAIIYPYVLVFVQISCLIYILVSGPLLANGMNGMLIECAGLFLGILAIFTMKPGNFNISPRIKSNGVLVTAGPYRIIRHPMYLAQIIAVLPLITDYFSWYRLGAIVLLTIALLFKIEYEEKQLVKHFPDYMAYTKTTKKLIPGLY